MNTFELATAASNDGQVCSAYRVSYYGTQYGSSTRGDVRAIAVKVERMGMCRKNSLSVYKPVQAAHLGRYTSAPKIALCRCVASTTAEHRPKSAIRQQSAPCLGECFECRAAHQLPGRGLSSSGP